MSLYSSALGVSEKATALPCSRSRCRSPNSLQAVIGPGGQGMQMTAFLFPKAMEQGLGMGGLMMHDYSVLGEGWAPSDHDGQGWLYPRVSSGAVARHGAERQK